MIEVIAPEPITIVVEPVPPLEVIIAPPGEGPVVWGELSGDITKQLDLVSLVNNKVLYGTAEPPDTTGLADGTLYFRYA